MDDQALLWVVLIALVACCLIPVILMGRAGRRESPAGPDLGGGPEPGDGGYRGRNNGQP